MFLQGLDEACLSNPCWNRGVCQSIGSTDFRCVCPSGTSGKNCRTISSAPCLTNNPCQNNAVCQVAPNNINGSFSYLKNNFLITFKKILFRKDIFVFVLTIGLANSVKHPFRCAIDQTLVLTEVLAQIMFVFALQTFLELVAKQIVNCLCDRILNLKILIFLSCRPGKSAKQRQDSKST